MENLSLTVLVSVCALQWLPLCFGILLLTKYVLFDSVRHSGLVSSRKARRSISSTLLFDLWPSRSAADIADASSAEGDESESRQLSAANAGDKADGAHASKVVDIPATLPTAIVGDSNTSPVSALAAEEVPPRFTLGSASSSCSEESEDVFPEAIQVPQEPRSLEECMRIKAEVGGMPLTPVCAECVHACVSYCAVHSFSSAVLSLYRYVCGSTVYLYMCGSTVCVYMCGSTVYLL